MCKNFKIIGLALVVTTMLLINCNTIKGAELPPTITLSTNDHTNSLTDKDYLTFVKFNKDDTVTITSKENIYGIYIVWNNPVSQYTVKTDSALIPCGANGFIHDYIALEKGTLTVTINIPSDNSSISEIRIFDNGELPKDVQVWQPPRKQADILLIPSHPDDEILFFGGIIPTYEVNNTATVQVLYMTSFWAKEPVREHEKLDGLWASGHKHYPVDAGLYDYHSTTLEKALTQYNLDSMVEYLVESIRKYKPQIIVTHDEAGEYGHGFHMLTFKATTLAVEAAADNTKYSDSFNKYGVWDTKKTYIHLYPENKIKLNLRTPIKNMNNRTALEIASYAYTLHKSQQKWGFVVSDSYVLSCADFGLYRSTVGKDTDNDMLCNITTYYEQEQKRLEEESIKESIANEQSSIDVSIKESLEASNQATNTLSSIISTTNKPASNNINETTTPNIFIPLSLCLICLALAILIFAGISKNHK